MERHGGLSLDINVTYKLTGETGSYRYMAPGGSFLASLLSFMDSLFGCLDSFDTLRWVGHEGPSGLWLADPLAIAGLEWYEQQFCRPATVL